MDYLTIDWDFFVPEKAIWDISHRESELYLNFLWTHRAGLIEHSKTSGEEKSFWRQLGVDMPDKVCVSDSHAYAYAVPGDADRVVLFDAHHDCWARNGDGVACDNWLRIWLEQDEAREALWVYPKHMIDNWGKQSIPKDLRSRVEVMEWKGKIELDEVDSVHVCRSGCWTPPWLDEDFIAFVMRGFQSNIFVMQDGIWDPMEMRWTADEKAEAIENHKKLIEMCQKVSPASV
jgi:hypothetical protein